MKRLLSTLLVLAVALGLMPMAAGAAQADHQQAADRLYGLGLVSGTGTDAAGKPIYELDRAPTRSEAITVLVKLLGKADEASKGGWQMPFTDVPDWAKNFVGYAYANGLTSGTSATTFGGNDPVTAAQYLTFVLKALGYSANGDFAWDRAWELSDKLGVTDGRYNAATNRFVRGDVFLISESALHVQVKSSGVTLSQQLMGQGVFTDRQYADVYGAALGELTSEQIFALCSPAVFYVEVYDAQNRPFATGSGFFLTGDGVAVTNHHVLEGASRAVITTSDTQQRYEVSGVYDFDRDNDWAVMQVEGTGFATLGIGSADTVQGGANVYAIGSPKGLQNTISQGLVSNPDRVVDGVHYIQTSAPISSGSSGGALINKYGQVIGITSAGFREGQNLNLAIPMTALEGWDGTRLKPITAVDQAGTVQNGRVEYSLSQSSVTVAAGGVANLTFSSSETGIGRTVTYSLVDGDVNVAEAAWASEDNEQQPWTIQVYGYKAGTTSLTITNDATSDTVTIPITVTGTAQQGHVDYHVSHSSVTVTEGSTTVISFSSVETGIDETVTYTLHDDNVSVAEADWESLEEEDQPWNIVIRGYKPGTASLTITNDITRDTVTIPITVTAKSSSSGQNAAFNMLKSYIIRYANNGSNAYRHVDDELVYNLEYDEKEGYILVDHFYFTDERAWYFGLYLTPTGNAYEVDCAMMDLATNQIQAFGSFVLDPATMVPDVDGGTFRFTEYEGQSTVRDTLGKIGYLQGDLALTFTQRFLTSHGSPYGLRDLGFSKY